MQYGHEKEQEVKTTQSDLNQLEISAITKTKFRDRFAKIVKAQLEEQKAQQKAEAKKVLDSIADHFDRHDTKSFISNMGVSTNQKAISDAITHVSKKNKDKTVYLFSVVDGKVIHGCHVSEVSISSSIAIT